MPAAVSGDVDTAASLALVPGMVGQVAERLGRDLAAEPARDTLIAALG
jgi:hypothetical protein